MNGISPAVLATLTALQFQQLGKAKEQFDSEVARIIGGTPAPAPAGNAAAGAPPASASTAQPAATAPAKGKRVMSEATKRAIALKQKANWAKRNRQAKKGGTKAKATGGGMSPAVKRKIAAAQKARWALRKGATAQPAAVPAPAPAAPQQVAA